MPPATEAPAVNRRAEVSRLEGRLDVGRGRVRHTAHDVVSSRRVSNLFGFCADDRSRDDRPRLPDRGPELLALRLDRGHRERIGQVPPLGVAAFESG